MTEEAISTFHFIMKRPKAYTVPFRLHFAGFIRWYSPFFRILTKKRLEEYLLLKRNINTVCYALI